MYGPAQENLVPIAYAQVNHLDTHADLPRGTICLKMSLGLHLHPYFVYASSEGSGESARMRRLA